MTSPSTWSDDDNTLATFGPLGPRVEVNLEIAERSWDSWGTDLLCGTEQPLLAMLSVQPNLPPCPLLTYKMHFLCRVSVDHSMLVATAKPRPATVARKNNGFAAIPSLEGDVALR